MAAKRRHIDAGSVSTTTAVILVAGGDEDVEAIADACRKALRETDAVLARRDGGVTSLLLRNLRDGAADTRVIVDRIVDQCATVTTAALRIGVAVSDGGDEPLDLLLRRAETDLGPAPAATAG